MTSIPETVARDELLSKRRPKSSIRDTERGDGRIVVDSLHRSVIYSREGLYFVLARAGGQNLLSSALSLRCILITIHPDVGWESHMRKKWRGRMEFNEVEHSGFFVSYDYFINVSPVPFSPLVKIIERQSLCPLRGQSGQYSQRLSCVIFYTA